MNPSPKAFEIVKAFEGCRLTAYLCPAGVWTIGWGTTGEVNGEMIHKGMTITKQEAEELLQHDLEDAAASVSSCLKVTLLQHQFDALVSFVYNLGGAALRKSTLLIKVNNKQFSDVPAQFKRWTKAHVPGHGFIDLPGLVRRRNAESKLWETGIVDTK